MKYIIGIAFFVLCANLDVFGQSKLNVQDNWFVQKDIEDVKKGDTLWLTNNINLLDKEKSISSWQHLHACKFRRTINKGSIDWNHPTIYKNEKWKIRQKNGVTILIMKIAGQQKEKYNIIESTFSDSTNKLVLVKQ